MRYAAQVSAEAHCMLMKSVKSVKYEYQLESIFVHYCSMRGYGFVHKQAHLNFLITLLVCDTKHIPQLWELEEIVQYCITLEIVRLFKKAIWC